MAFLLTGKKKVRFLLSLQIKHLQSKRLICAPVHGRVDNFLRSHQGYSEKVRVLAHQPICRVLNHTRA